MRTGVHRSVALGDNVGRGLIVKFAKCLPLLNLFIDEETEKTNTVLRLTQLELMQKGLTSKLTSPQSKLGNIFLGKCLNEKGVHGK